MIELTRQRVALGAEVNAVRQLELERLDLLRAAIWTDAMPGNRVAGPSICGKACCRRRVAVSIRAEQRPGVLVPPPPW